MPILRIPSPLRNYTGGLNEVPVQGSNVSEAMQSLVAQHPALQNHIYNGKGELRPFVNLFLGEENIKDLQGLDTPLNEGSRILLIPSIAGGWSFPVSQIWQVSISDQSYGKVIYAA